MEIILIASGAVAVAELAIVRGRRHLSERVGARLEQIRDAIDQARIDRRLRAWA